MAAPRPHLIPLARRSSLGRAKAGRSGCSILLPLHPGALGSLPGRDQGGIEVDQGLRRFVGACAHAANLQEVRSPVMCQSAPVLTQVWPC